jgi:hypothetical protein
LGVGKWLCGVDIKDAVSEEFSI